MLDIIGNNVDKENICPKCGAKLQKQYIKLGDVGGYDFLFEEEYFCTCGFKRINK